MAYIPGWTITAEKAAEIRAAVAFEQGVDPEVVDSDYIRRLMAVPIQQAVAAYRRSLRDSSNPIDRTNPLD